MLELALGLKLEGLALCELEGEFPLGPAFPKYGGSTSVALRPSSISPCRAAVPLAVSGEEGENCMPMFGRLKPEGGGTDEDEDEKGAPAYIRERSLYSLACGYSEISDWA